MAATVDSDAPKFVYSPLDLSSNNIRELKILPGESATIFCELTECLLQTDHVCLSYTWGDESASEAIIVNDRRFMVRPNLWRFLSEARRRCTDASIWIDGVCLSQDDVRERNHQVQRMAEIYKKAECVIVWLGRASPAAESILLKRTFRHPSLRPGGASTSLPSFSCDDEEHALLELYRHTYWQRLWIVQELLLAQKAVIWCNDSEFDLRAFITICETSLATKGDISRDAPRLTSTEKSSSELAAPGRLASGGFALKQFLPRPMRTDGKRLVPRPPAEQLSDLISRWSNQRCRDARDKVSGLLGLADGGHLFPIDYDITTAELWLNAVDWSASRELNMSWPRVSTDLYKCFELTSSAVC